MVCRKISGTRNCWNDVYLQFFVVYGPHVILSKACVLFQQVKDRLSHRVLVYIHVLKKSWSVQLVLIESECFLYCCQNRHPVRSVCCACHSNDCHHRHHDHAIHSAVFGTTFQHHCYHFIVISNAFDIGMIVMLSEFHPCVSLCKTCIVNEPMILKFFWLHE